MLQNKDTFKITAAEIKFVITVLHDGKTYR